MKLTTEELFEMILLHKSEEFMKIINKIEDINCLSESRANLLQQAISERQFVIAQELIEKGINIDNQDENGMTVLHYLPFYFDMNIGRLLLKKGANVNIKDSHGNNPLWYSFSNNKCNELSKLLVAAGADIYSKNIHGKSVFDKTLKFEGEALEKVKALLNIN